MQNKIKLKLLNIIISLFGVILSYYTVYEHFAFKRLGTGSSLCNISATVNCKSVILSKYSEFLGLPIGIYGVLFYFFILVLLTAPISIIKEKVTNNTLAFLGFVSLVFSIILFCISKFKLGVICPVCFGLYIVSFLLFIINLFITKFKIINPKYLFSEALNIFKLKIDILTKESFINKFLVLFFPAILVFGSFSFLNSYFKKTEPKTISDIFSVVDLSKKTFFKLESESLLSKDFSKGAKDYKVQLVKFADLECPFCLSFVPILNDLVKEYPDTLQVVYKNFPLDKACNKFVEMDLHKNACFLAQTARCAGEEGKFWEVLSSIESESDNFVKDFKNQIESLDINYSNLKSCLESKRHLPKIKDDINVGEAKGVTGTPVFWINGYRVTSSSKENLKLVIEYFLNNDDSK